MNYKASLFVVALTLGGCVSMTPRAQRIQLHPANSTQLNGCQKLGPVTAEASAWTQMNWPDVDEQAEINLRDAAAAKWGSGVDSVGLTNIDNLATKAIANGVAYKCF